jgi:membrane protease YdiL (CAAX protease family)
MNTTVNQTGRRMEFLKPFWTDLAGPPWVLSLVVFAVIVSIRFFAYLSPIQLPALFFLHSMAMWLIPFWVMNQEGRSEIGLSARGLSFRTMILGALAGAACAIALLGLGYLLFGSSADNWCFSIRDFLHFDEVRGMMPPIALFALYSLPAVFLNPIGEEILFRGFIQQAFARRFHRGAGVFVSSLLFGLAYLYIHGIWHDSSGYHLRILSGSIAVVLLAFIGSVFSLCRKKSGSLWPAAAAHAGFNLTILAVEIHYFVH